MERVTDLMSNFIFYPVFILITVLLYWPSFWAYYAWSGRRYSAFKFWGVGSYNVLCATIHNFLCETARYLLWGMSIMP